MLFVDQNVPPKKKKQRRPLTVENVSLALVRHLGNYATIAKRFGVTRRAVSLFIDRHPELQEVRDDAREFRIDEYESALDKGMKKIEGWAVCFFLKTQGSSRGYNENERLSALEKKIEQLEKLLTDHANSGGT